MAAHKEVELRVGEAVQRVKAEKDTLEKWESRARGLIDKVVQALSGDDDLGMFSDCQVLICCIVIPPFSLLFFFKIRNAVPRMLYNSNWPLTLNLLIFG